MRARRVGTVESAERVGLCGANWNTASKGVQIFRTTLAEARLGVGGASLTPKCREVSDSCPKAPQVFRNGRRSAQSCMDAGKSAESILDMETKYPAYNDSSTVLMSTTY